jgi:hypothetical protein
MFILYGLYSFVSMGGPSCKNLSSSILAIDSRFFVSAFARSLSILRLVLSATMISRLLRFDSPFDMGVEVPLVFPFKIGEAASLSVPFGGVLFAELLIPSSLLGTESTDVAFEELLWLISFSFLKGRLRNDILATVGWGVQDGGVGGYEGNK